MKNENNQTHSRRVHLDEVPDLMLGKRHEKVERDVEEMFRTARVLGFSAKEILELERVYQIKSNK